jgi:hypothetical protein
VDRNFEAAIGVLEGSLLVLALLLLTETPQLAEGAMRNACFVLMAAFAISIASTAQTSPSTSQTPPPQTARQAVIEMFMGKSPDAFLKHLPSVASQALVRKGENPATSMVQKISMLGQQLAAQGHVQTFDEGPTLLLSEQEEGKKKVKTEVVVERDSLMGESDEIELSIHVYNDGEPEFLPIVPRLIFTLTQENNIWRLTEATLAAHVPLTDPDYLKGVRRKEDESEENMASARVNTIAAAEIRYASTQADHGYSCKLTELFARTVAAEHSDQISETENSGLGLDESSGYRISLTGCSGNPSSKFQVLAVPTDSDAGMKTFCADETGMVRFEMNGKGTSCLTRGQVLYQAATVSTVEAD